MPTFHYALNPTGFLVLGSAETVGEFTELFEVVDRAAQDLREEAGDRPRHQHFSAYDHRLQAMACRLARGRAGPRRHRRRTFRGRPTASCSAATRRPACWSTRTATSCSSAGGPARISEPPPASRPSNLLKMAREGLFLELRSALAEAEDRRSRSAATGVRVRDDERIPRGRRSRSFPVRLPGDRRELLSSSCSRRTPAQ